MGVDTKAKLLGNPTVQQIASVIRGTFNLDDVTVDAAGTDVFRVYFPDPLGKTPGAADRRMMFVFPDYSDDDGPVSGKHTLCMLGAFGGSVVTADALAARFGGYVLEQDTNDDWRFVAGSEGNAPSPKDAARLRLETILGQAEAIPFVALLDKPAELAAVLDVYATTT